MLPTYVSRGNNNSRVLVIKSVNESIRSLTTPLDSLNANVRPSHADFSKSVEPSTVFNRSFSIRSNSPETSSNDWRNSRAESAPEMNAVNAATDRRSVNSNASFRSVPDLRNLINPSIISSNVLAGPPIAFANLPLASANFKIILRVAVAALDASKPALASDPKRAVVSLTVSPNAFATGKTVPIEFCILSNDKADLFVATASVANTSSVSRPERLNARNVEPATDAASARFAPTAVANCNTDFCIEIIDP